MKILLFVFRSSPLVVALALLAALLSGLFSGSLIALIHSAIGDAATTPAHLGLRFWALVLLTLISAVAANITIAWLYRRLLVDLQLRVAERITQTPLRDLEDIGNSSLLAMLTDDVDKIGEIATSIVPLITNVVTSIVCFGYLIWLSWHAFFGTLLFLILGAFSYKVLISRERKILAAGRDELDSLYRYFHDLTHGIKELKLNQDRGRAFLGQVLRPAANTVQRYLFLWDVVYAAISTWGRFLILVVVGLVLFLLPRYFDLQPVVLSGYVLSLLYVRSSLLSVIETLPHISAAVVALRKIESFGLDLSVEALRPVSSTSLPDMSGPLRLIEVTHSYRHDREDSVFTLGPIHLTLEKGEVVFLVGGNGSGKTTLAKVIMGLYPPESGEIHVGHTAICDGNRMEYSQLFAAVFTDFHLFEDLLGLGCSNLDDRVKHYLSKLDLDFKVKVENGRLSTTRALSRGQQQRLALLAAYLEDRPFYLFDEWAANQDPVFKEVFYTQLLPELKAKGKAVLVISHDDQYFHVGDRILKLADGKLV